MFTLKNCCCGCSLMNGTISIGILYLVTSSAMLVWFSNSADQVFHLETETNKSVFKYAPYVLKTLLLTLAVASAVRLLVTMVLLAGVLTEKAALVLPWAFSQCIMLAIYLSAGGIGGAYCIYMHLWKTGIGLLIGQICNIGLEAYFVLVVFSLYKQMKEKSASPSISHDSSQIHTIHTPRKSVCQNAEF